MVKPRQRSMSLALPLGSNGARSALLGDTRLVNAFVEPSAGRGQAKATYGIYGVSGLERFAVTSDAPCRGLIEADGALYSINGSRGYKVTSAGVVTDIGAIAGVDRVAMARNAAVPFQIAIVAAAGVYKIESDAISYVFLPALDSAVVDVAWVDGYFVFGLANGQFFVSGLNETTVDALDFAIAEGLPDGLVAVKVFRREVYLFGTQTTEVWSNTGDADFPFARLPGAVLPVGCAARDCVAVLDDAIMWVDDAGLVRKLTAGYVPSRVSTQAVERAIEGVDRSTLEAVTWTERGHVFYALSSPSWTWVYDTGADEWHERRSPFSDRWQVNALAPAWNGNYAGSSRTGRVFRITTDVFREDRDTLTTIIRFPPLDNFPAGATVDELAINIETGVGSWSSPLTMDDTVTASFDSAEFTMDQSLVDLLDTTAGGLNEPLISLRWSDDGSKSWSNAITLPLGRRGEYSTVVTFNRLGAFLDKGRTFEASISSPVFRAMVSARVQVEPLDR